MGHLTPDSTLDDRWAEGSTVVTLGGGSAGPTVAFRVLGPLEMAVDDVVVDLGGAQRRAMLALLLVAEGRSVSEEALIESLWGDDPGESARNNLQSHVSRLRAAMGRAGLGRPHEVLQRTSDGYRLRVEPSQVDTDRVCAGTAGAGARRVEDPDGAADLLSEALALWRGRPLEELFGALPG